MPVSKNSIKRRTKLATRKARTQRHINRGEATVTSYITPKGQKLLEISKLTKKARKEIADKYRKNRYRKAS